MTNISIVGAGGHTRSSVNLLKSHFKNVKYKIYDDSYNEINNEYIAGIKVAGKLSEIIDDSSVFLSVGDNELREKYFNQYEKQLIEKNIFHKTVFCEDNVDFGIANQVYAFCYINSFSIIGDNNIFNTASVVEHEVNIGSHNHISVGAKICGRASIQSGCTIGAGATIIDGVSICNNVIVGAGAVVTKNIVEEGVYVGVPVRKIG